jgi:hypothetical protein
LFVLQFEAKTSLQQNRKPIMNKRRLFRIEITEGCRKV